MTGAFANIAGSTVTYVWKGDAENALVAGVDFSDHLHDNISLFARANGQLSNYERAGDFTVVQSTGSGLVLDGAGRDTDNPPYCDVVIGRQPAVPFVFWGCASSAF